jgi:hypothetical protein
MEKATRDRCKCKQRNCAVEARLRALFSDSRAPKRMSASVSACCTAFAPSWAVQSVRGVARCNLYVGVRGTIRCAVAAEKTGAGGWWGELPKRQAKKSAAVCRRMAGTDDALGQWGGLAMTCCQCPKTAVFLSGAGLPAVRAQSCQDEKRKKVDGEMML